MRRGTTLVEALIAIVVLTLVGGLVATAMVGEQRTARAVAEVAASRAELSAATAILARELRSASLAGDSFYLATDTAVEFSTPILAGVSCAPSSAGSVPLAPSRERGGSALTSAVATPDSDDVAWLWYADSAAPTGAWRRYGVAALANGGTCATEFAAVSGTPQRLILSGLSAAPAGAVVQVVRRARFSFYRSSDSRWYLGYRRCVAAPVGCRTIQPVAGPYRQRAGGAPGLELRFIDESGVVLDATSARTHTARVEIVARSDTQRHTARIPARGAGSLDDSTRATAAIRNAR